MRRGDLFVLSWESLRRVEWGKVSSFLSMSGGGLFNCTILSLLTLVSWHSMAVFYVVFMYHIVLANIGLLALHGSVLCGMYHYGMYHCIIVCIMYYGMYHFVLTDVGLLALHGSVLCGMHVSYCPCLHGSPGILWQCFMWYTCIK